MRGRRFQFPSNGKAYPKVTSPEEMELAKMKFPFPSNGKAYPKFNPHPHPHFSAFVSIPFKRESVSKEVTKDGVVMATGNTTFPFPSNGKAYPKL